jgi:hypothetical protein
MTVLCWATIAHNFFGKSTKLDWIRVRRVDRATALRDLACHSQLNPQRKIYDVDCHDRGTQETLSAIGHRAQLAGQPQPRGKHPAQNESSEWPSSNAKCCRPAFALTLNTVEIVFQLFSFARMYTMVDKRTHFSIS